MTCFLLNGTTRQKIACWKELIADLDRDPCGFAYKRVIKRLKSANSSVTEVLPKAHVDEILNVLFPLGLPLPRRGVMGGGGGH